MLSGFKERKQKRKAEQQEREEKLLHEFLETRNLTEISQGNKEFVDLIRQQFEEATRYSIRGSEVDIQQVELMVTLIEQNWLIIKLLNEINKKLDR